MMKFILLSNFCRCNSLIYDQLLSSVIVLEGGMVDGVGGGSVGG